MAFQVVTAQDMYDALSDELNKEKTGTIFPDEFERLINRAQLDYIEDRYNNVEGSQKRIDDLREVVVLDESVVNTGPNVAGQEIFVLPYATPGFIATPKNPAGDNHGYLFMLAAAFRITYLNSPCGYTGASQFLKAKVMRSDKRYEVLRDPFNRPAEERLYYQITGNTMRLYTGSASFGTEALIDYIRYPREISLTPAVDSELGVHARGEVVKLAARRYKLYIEHPGYQSQLVEDKQITT